MPPDHQELNAKGRDTATTEDALGEDAQQKGKCVEKTGQRQASEVWGKVAFLTH